MHYLNTVNGLGGGPYSLYLTYEDSRSTGWTAYTLPAWCTSYSAWGVNGVVYFTNDMSFGSSNWHTHTQTTGARPARHVTAEEMERVKTELLGY